MRPLNARVVLLAAMICAVSGVTAHAQDEQANNGPALLKQGITEYKTKQFSKAQATLLQVKRDKLSDTEKKDLDTYLTNVRIASQKQAEAYVAYESANKAMKANDFGTAQDLFDKVAKSEYAPDQLRKDADINRKLASRKASAPPSAAPAGAPAADAAANKPLLTPAPSVADVIPEAASEPAAPTETTPAPATPPVVTETPSAVETPAPVTEPVVPVVPAAPEVPAAAAAEPSAEPALPAPVASEPVIPAPAPAPEVAAAPASSPTTEIAAQPPLSADAKARVAKAKQLMLQADECLDAQNVDQAIRLYEQAVAAAPEYEPAKVGLSRAQTFTGQSAGLAAIGKLEQARQVRKQETDVRYAQSLQRAREAIQSAKSSDDFARGADEVNQARMLLSTNKSLYSDAEYRQKMVQTDELSRFVDTERTRWEERRVASERQQVQHAEQERRVTTQRQQKERVEALKARVNALIKEQKYSQAVEVLEQILRIDPKDQEARARYEEYKNFVLLLEDKQAAKDNLDQEARQFVDIRQSQIPWYQILMYPQDWPEITRRRQAIGAEDQAETEADRVVHRRLATIQKKLELTGVPLSQAIDFIRDVSGLNIVPKWNVLEQAGITRETVVNVKLQDVTIDKALRTILEDVGGVNPLGYVVSDGVVTISTKDDLSRQTVTHVYDIRDLIVSVPNFDPPSIGLGSSGTGTGTSGGTTGGSTGGTSGGSSGLGGGSSSSSGSNGSSGNGANRDQLITNILDLIQTTIDTNSWVEHQGTVGTIRELNGNVIVTQTADNHRALMALLSQLRESKALQISIETRFIQVSTSFLNRIGIDMDFFFNIGTTLKSTATLDPVTGARILGTGPGTQLPQWQNQPGNGNVTPIPVRFDSSTFVSGVASGVGQDIGSVLNGTNGVNVAGSFLDDIQVDFLLNATQANESTRSLQAPRLTIYNTQRAYVMVARVQYYVSGVNPIVVENVAAYQPVVSQVMTGTVMGVEGTISADRRYVTMTLRPTLQAIERFVEYQGIPGVEGSGRIQLPVTNIQDVACTVSVPDGGTLLLGGLKLAGEQEREMGVPIVSKIPVLNRFVTNRSMVRDEQSTLILVKPKIIIQKEYEEAAFPP